MTVSECGSRGQPLRQEAGTTTLACIPLPGRKRPMLPGWTLEVGGRLSPQGNTMPARWESTLEWWGGVDVDKKGPGGQEGPGCSRPVQEKPGLCEGPGVQEGPSKGGEGLVVSPGLLEALSLVAVGRRLLTWAPPPASLPAPLGTLGRVLMSTHTLLVAAPPPRESLPLQFSRQTLSLKSRRRW